MSLYQITAEHFVAGFETTKGGLINRAPPIIYYMRGWTIIRATAYAKKKGWKLEHVLQTPEQTGRPGD